MVPSITVFRTPYAMFTLVPNISKPTAHQPPAPRVAAHRLRTASSQPHVNCPLLAARHVPPAPKPQTTAILSAAITINSTTSNTPLPHPHTLSIPNHPPRYQPKATKTPTTPTTHTTPTTPRPPRPPPRILVCFFVVGGGPSTETP